MKLLRNVLVNYSARSLFLFVGGLPLAIATILAVMFASARWTEINHIDDLTDAYEVTQVAVSLIHQTQIERGLTVSFVQSDGTQFRDRLSEQRETVDRLRGELVSRIQAAESNGHEFQQFFTTVTRMVGDIDTNRETVDRLQISAPDAAALYSSVISAIVYEINQLALDQFNDFVNAMTAFMRAKDTIGIERAVATGAVTDGALSTQASNRILTFATAQDIYFNAFGRYDDPLIRKEFDIVVAAPETAAVLRLRERIMSGDLTDLDPTTVFATYSARLNLLHQIEQKLVADLLTRTSAILRAEQVALVQILCVVIAAIVSTAGIVLVLSRAQADLFDEVVSAADAMCAGNLDAPLPDVGTNRMSDIIRAIARFRDSARENRQLAAERAEQERLEVEAIRRRAEQDQSRASRIASDLEQTAQAAEELAASVASAAASTRTVDDLAKVVSRQTAGGDAEVQSAMGAMDRISTAQNEITSIINIIEEIAFQTNLLALNARVEAARAGEYGRGFAVVATEVQQLAARSTRAANEVSGLIEKATHEIEGGVKIVKQSGKTLGEISKGNAEIAETISSVARMLDEQSSTLNDISAAAGRLDNEMRGLSQGDMRVAAE